jgi:hypothetical protein
VCCACIGPWTSSGGGVGGEGVVGSREEKASWQQVYALYGLPALGQEFGERLGYMIMLIHDPDTRPQEFPQILIFLSKLPLPSIEVSPNCLSCPFVSPASSYRPFTLSFPIRYRLLGISSISRSLSHPKKVYIYAHSLTLPTRDRLLLPTPSLFFFSLNLDPPTSVYITDPASCFSPLPLEDQRSTILLGPYGFPRSTCRRYMYNPQRRQGL